MVNDPSSDPRLESVRASSVRYLFENSYTGLAVNTILALLIAWVLSDHAATPTTLLWLGGVLAITLLRLGYTIYFNRHFRHDRPLRHWLVVFFIGSSLTAILWGMSIWWFAPYDSMEIPVFLAFAVGGLTGGAAAILGVVSPVYWAYALANMVPITIWFFLYESPTAQKMAAMLAVFTIAMLITGRIYRRVTLRAIYAAHDLRAAKEGAEAGNRAKDQFLNHMSHELRTPMNAILGFAQLLETDEEITDEQKTHVAEIMFAGEHLLDMIADLLDLSKIESGVEELSREPVAVGSTINECVTLASQLATDKHVQVSLNIDSDIVVWADPRRIRQVVLNLLSNAIKYNVENGAVLISASISGKSARVEVTDTGMGIDSRRLQNVFKPFDRLGHENSSIEGTGIGLALSKKIIESMGGHIGVTSNKQTGSTFWFELPRVT